MIHKEIVDMAVEAITPHNDGWVKKGYIEKLKKARKTANSKEKTLIRRALLFAEIR